MILHKNVPKFAIKTIQAMLVKGLAMFIMQKKNISKLNSTLTKLARKIKIIATMWRKIIISGVMIMTTSKKPKFIIKKRRMMEVIMQQKVMKLF